MSITRITITNDDGTGTTGTLADSAFMTDLYDDLDAWVANRASVTFAAGNFTANGTMTWTLASADQVNFWYQTHNKLMTVGFKLDTTSVGGTPNTELRITIPNGASCALDTYQKVAWANDNGTVREAYMVATGTIIAIRRQDAGNWTASTNATYVYGSITFPIS